MVAADDALLAQQRHRVRRAILIGEADYRPRLPGTLKVWLHCGLAPSPPSEVVRVITWTLTHIVTAC